MMETKQPNILFLFPDQHRGDWMPYDPETNKRIGMEALPIRLPHVQQLMKEGVTFTRAITPSPLCAPARACLAAGVRYEACGVPSNAADYPLEQRTVYSALRESGYSVGGVGKFDLHKNTEFWGLDGWIPDLDTLGFTHGIDNAGKLDAFRSGAKEPQDPYMNYLYEHGLAELHLRDMEGRRGDNKTNTQPTPLPDEAYCDNWLTRNGVQMLRNFPQDKPWFLAVNFTGPHHPWDVTAGMKKRWENTDFPQPTQCSVEMLDTYNRIRQNYAAMLENIDYNIGLLLDEVKARGEWEQTLIIYSSDHGEMLGDYDAFNKMRPERGSVDIPLVIKGPGIQQGKVSEALVELQDLTATMLDYAGGSLSANSESVSLKPQLTGADTAHRSYQYSALGDWKMAAVESYKLIVQDHQADRLYHTATDPWETVNVASQHPEIVADLKLLMREKMAE
jgi:arylsulfatase